MRDILFKCWNCSKSLAIPDQAEGKNIFCPDCSTRLVIPRPSIIYKCVYCGYELCSPRMYAGEEAGCPSCEHILTIPEQSDAPQEPIADSGE
jgi:DNA-directed RNA polymerase subunit RPC12/RpoP